MGEVVVEKSRVRPCLNSRLASMGFVPGVEIRVVSNGHPGPFVVIIKDIKMVLGRGVAQKVFVQ